MSFVLWFSSIWLPIKRNRRKGNFNIFIRLSRKRNSLSVRFVRGRSSVFLNIFQKNFPLRLCLVTEKVNNLFSHGIVALISQERSSGSAFPWAYLSLLVFVQCISIFFLRSEANKNKNPDRKEKIINSSVSPEANIRKDNFELFNKFRAENPKPCCKRFLCFSFLIPFSAVCLLRKAMRKPEKSKTSIFQGKMDLAKSSRVSYEWKRQWALFSASLYAIYLLP